MIKLMQILIFCAEKFAANAVNIHRSILLWCLSSPAVTLIAIFRPHRTVLTFMPPPLFSLVTIPAFSVCRSERNRLKADLDAFKAMGSDWFSSVRAKLTAFDAELASMQ